MANIQASIITIGDELLIGQTIDTNSTKIAQMLNAIGIDVIRRVAVGDNKAAIVKALDEEILAADVILITGGLGPTTDDITKPLLCDYFGGKLVVDEKVLAHVKSIFEKRKRPFLERNLKQAEVPDVSTVLHNRVGTAPGMLFEKNEKLVISMPGVPFEMEAIMQDEVVPLLAAKYKSSDVIVHRTTITAGEGESFIAEQIQDIENSLPAHISLAYLPSLGGVKLRLTGKAHDLALLTTEVEGFQQQLATRLEKIVIALEDKPMEVLLGELFIEKGLTVALAESCTGGYIGHLLTQVAGSSNYFQGSAVCYANEAKKSVLGVNNNTIEQYGAVSEQTVIEMALGAKRIMNSNIAFAISGVLSAGGEDYRVPVGTVWTAVTDGKSTKTKELRFYHDRIRNKESAAQMGMLMIWRFLNNKLK